MTQDIDYARDVFRDAVLGAMDKAAREIFGVTRNDAGATDEDLPRLFRCLDEQLNVLSVRFNHPLYPEHALNDMLTSLAVHQKEE